MNFTIMSLSVLSLYSISPIFVSNRNFISKSTINYFFCLTIFLNQQYLEIEKTSFIHGIGSILHSEHSESITEIFEKNFDPDNSPNGLIDESTEKKLLIIRDCTFSLLSGSNYLIKINNEKSTFYMTSCTFQKCQFSSGLQFIKSRATTYSHICFSDSYQVMKTLL